jgi:hypothetical protein
MGEKCPKLTLENGNSTTLCGGITLNMLDGSHLLQYIPVWWSLPSVSVILDGGHWLQSDLGWWSLASI